MGARTEDVEVHHCVELGGVRLRPVVRAVVHLARVLAPNLQAQMIPTIAAQLTESTP